MPSSVHIDSYREWSGGQAQSLGLALALAARGEETHFIVQPGSELAARIRGTHLSWEAMPLRGLIGLSSAGRLARRLRGIGPDIVHIHESASHVVAGMAARVAGKPKIIVTRRTERPLRSGWVGVGKYRLWCDKLICVSEAIKRRYLNGGLPEKLLTVIPDFVDCRHFDPAAAPARDSATSPTVLIVGQLSPDKGHRILLWAMREVIRRTPDACLRIVGQGEEEPRLRAQAQRLGLGTRVEFTGFLPDVRSALAQADVFVQPSLLEGLGLAVLEAMAMARPVVVSDAGGLPELVARSETGLVVPAGDAGALTEAILSLLQNPDRARHMGAAGRERALRQFDRSMIVERMLALYDEVLSEARR